MTGEYVPPEIPAELRGLDQAQEYAPSPFQPTTPKQPDAYELLLPLNGRGQPVDLQGNRIEDNTIIECARDVDHGRWRILRTRYDKTYRYRVRRKAEYGNDAAVAENIWTNIHVPVTEEMLRTVVANPISDTFEDELYYKDSLASRNRTMRDVMTFHNAVKEALYLSTVRPGDTLLELAMGRANDLHKWRKSKPSKVVGVEYSKGNLEGARQGACVRYLTEATREKLPPALFIEGDMTQPLLEQDNRYLKLLDKREPASTPYLQQFVGLTEFDVISCQNAIHYACKDEATFRTFVGNLTRHGSGLFFGTCMDGQSVYAHLLGKTGYIFRAGDGQVFGEFAKEYPDGDTWTEAFGQTIQVKLESFVKPEQEYLVPFETVTEILKENGFELVRTSLFRDAYSAQTKVLLDGDLQAFSFLHRSFVFKRVAAPPKKEEEAPKEETKETPKEETKEEEQTVEVPTTAEPKKKTLKVKVPKEDLPEPVFFFAGNPALSEFKVFTVEHEAPLQIDGITFPTVEHYYQWSKAKQFGDAGAQAKILKTPSAKSVKAIGRKVTPFDEAQWKDRKDTVMRAALRAKLMQHPEILKTLRDTGDRPLAEADPRSKYWGIGTSSDTSKAKDPARWPGQNRLGKLLEELRTEMKE
jgi:ribA/ribD-fused uncharacterized protein